VTTAALIDFKVSLYTDAQHPRTKQPDGSVVVGWPYAHVWVRDGKLCVDREVKLPLEGKGLAARMKKGKIRETVPWREFQVQLDDIVNIEIEGITQQHARGYSLVTGFLGSGKQVPGTTGVLITTKQGWIMLSHNGLPPLQVKAMWTPLLSGLSG
jgi:hypothetical protein